MTRATQQRYDVVADVMLREPIVLPESATVSDVRAVLRSDHVHMVLITRAGRVGEPLRGTVVRTDLDAAPAAGMSPDDAEPALTCSRLAGRTVGPTEPVDDVRRALVAAGLRRAAVVDDAGLLLGLVCLKRDGTGFCSDAGVASRRADDGVRRPRAR
jgi:CBS domain-containing protein